MNIVLGARRLLGFYSTIAFWAALPTIAYGQIGDCIRLDDHQSPSSYSAAWNQYSPTRFEVADGGLRKIQFRFDDSQAELTIVLDAEEAESFVRAAQELATAPTGTSSELGFTAWFKLGPTWHGTGQHKGRGVLARLSDPDDDMGRGFALEFHRLISEQSSFTTYLPASLYFSDDLLAQVSDVVDDGLVGNGTGSQGRACGYAGIIPAE